MTAAAAGGSFRLGGDLTVRRLGFGAMRITGAGVWGPPVSHSGALAVLRRAVELGVTFIDTAESYGPHVSEALIAEALYPYAGELVIATKGGYDRPAPGVWNMNGRPERLLEGLNGSLRRLRLERIDLYQLHRIDPAVPEGEQFGALQRFQQQGKIRHVGLSEVGVDEIRRARAFFPVVSVQNRYNLADRRFDEVVDYCGREGIAFIPWSPLQAGRAIADSHVAEIAGRRGVAPPQVMLAWLLHRSPAMLPIPGTSRVDHLEENVEASALKLSAEEYQRLTA